MLQVVALLMRPNTPVAGKLLNYADFISCVDCTSIINLKVIYAFDEKVKPQYGTAILNRATNQLSYVPNPILSVRTNTVDEKIRCFAWKALSMVID